MANEITIPALPCASLTETLNFYVALGFEITYQQERPNNYGCVKYGDIEVHFFSMKGYEVANSYSTCLVLIDDANALHQIFKARLKAQLGKVPIAGIPRLTRPSNNNASGDFRFNVVDPGGNWIRFIERNSTKEKPDLSTAESTALSRVIYAVSLLIDAKGDFPKAAKMLDVALSKGKQNQTDLERIQALILRAEIAINLDDQGHAKNLLEEIDAIPLSEAEQSEIHASLARANELREMLD